MPLGACEANVNEDKNDDLRTPGADDTDAQIHLSSPLTCPLLFGDFCPSPLGNQDQKVQEQRHSAELPMGTMRMRAGLHKADAVNHNPRTVCEVPEELKNEVFPWVGKAITSFNCHCSNLLHLLNM